MFLAILNTLIKFEQTNYMSVSKLKEQLHHAIDSIEDEEFLNAVLTILTSRGFTSYDELEEKQLRIVKEREEKYMRGETKTLSLEEFKSKLKHKYGL
jgi:hypothetical protein